MLIGVLKETAPRERRVALVPDGAAALIGKGLEVVVEAGAGERAYYPDKAYADKGARIASRADDVLTADVLLEVSLLGNDAGMRQSLLANMRPGQVIIGLMNPLGDLPLMEELASRGVTAFALELLPRITRAQSMDVLSSMATAAGYAAVIRAAEVLPRFFPMLMTAAGTVAPARVFVIGAGVAGLMAIATARRLGAVVHAYDVRPAVKQEVQSLGARFVELELETDSTADTGGYAKAMDENFYGRQRELMSRTLAHSDVVISTASVPGKKAPVLITKEMVALMPPGSVIMDLASEQGGNCELTRAGEAVTENGVTIIGPVNLPASVPYHSSQMYSKNVTAFLLHLEKEHLDGQIPERLLATDDQIVHDTLVTLGGEVVHSRVRELLGKQALAVAQKETM